MATLYAQVAEWVARNVRGDPQPVAAVNGSTRRELTNRMRQRGRAPLSPWTPLAGVLFGAPFMAAGSVVMFGWCSMDPRFCKEAWPFLLLFGPLFFCAGAAIALGGIATFCSGMRRWARARRFPGQPWLADYDWNPRGTSDETGKSAIWALIGAVCLGVFLTPFHWVLFHEGAAWLVFPLLIVGVFDLLVCFLFCKGVYHTLQHFKYGRSRILFDRFPFFLGETLDVRWATGKPVGWFRKIEITLRCVEEHTETDGHGESTRKTYELLAQALSIEKVGVHADVRPLPLSFTLPPGPYETQFTAAVPRYWELEIRAATPGVGYSAVFLVPVYARPLS